MNDGIWIPGTEYYREKIGRDELKSYLENPGVA